MIDVLLFGNDVHSVDELRDFGKKFDWRETRFIITILSLIHSLMNSTNLLETIARLINIVSEANIQNN